MHDDSDPSHRPPHPSHQLSEQQLSQAMLATHGPRLATEAAEVLAHSPGIDPVGLIIDGRAPEVSQLKEMSDLSDGDGLAGVSGLFPRSLVRELLGQNHTALLDWLVGSTADDGSRVLPLVAITQNGAQIGAQPIPRP